MGTFTKLLAACIAGLGVSYAAAATAQPFMYVGSTSTQPVGHYEFCQRQAGECQPTADANAPTELTRALWDEIVAINNVVNLSIEPRTDKEIWGVEEVWSYPVNGVGDCEDYVLEKQRRLRAAGVPASNLLIAVVRQANGDGHAVLVVHTTLGDFVLDNLEMRVLPWTETGYTYLKRQSRQHAGTWVGIDDDRQLLVGSVTANR